MHKQRLTGAKIQFYLFVCLDSYLICLPGEVFYQSACVTNRANVPAKNKKSPIGPGKLLPTFRVLWRSGHLYHKSFNPTFQGY